MSTVEQRSICWPDFDVVCLKDGCVHCQDHQPRSVEAIEKAVAKKDDPHQNAWHYWKLRNR